MGSSVAPVKPNDPAAPHILSGDEWEQSQYAPHRAGQDPTKPMGGGRILTGDEWEQAQSSPNFGTLKFPAMPKIASDATKRLNPNAGAPDATVGGFVRNVSGSLDVAAQGNAFGPGGNIVAHGLAAVGRQAIAPAVEHPLLTAALANPVGAVIGTGMAVTTIAQYGWRKAHELTMSPEERARSEADPNRVSGEAAAVQAAMLGLGFLAGVHGRGAAPEAPGVTPSLEVALEGAAPPAAPTEPLGQGVKPAATETPSKPTAAFFESPKGAEVLGTAAAAHGLPETASPYPPATFLDQAWTEGHASAAPAAPAPTTEVGAGGLAPVEGTGVTKTRGLAAGVEEKAVANKLTESLGDLPEYKSVNMADQASQATRLLSENPESAHRIATGEEQAPKGLLPESVFKAVEDKALNEGDVATIRDLASSKLTEQATTMGQRIRALAERDPESPVAAIQRIAESRNPEGADEAISGMVTELRRHLDESSASIDEDAWTKFINSIRC